MIAYYPLEHLYYLRAHTILPAALALPFFKKSISLNTGKIGLWSTRFWAAYVFLQFAHLREDHHLLKLRERALNKVKGKGKASEEVTERADLARRWDALINELIVNLGYLPLTLHWCVLISSHMFYIFKAVLSSASETFFMCSLTLHALLLWTSAASACPKLAISLITLTVYSNFPGVSIELPYPMELSALRLQVITLYYSPSLFVRTAAVCFEPTDVSLSVTVPHMLQCSCIDFQDSRFDLRILCQVSEAVHHNYIMSESPQEKMMVLIRPSAR